MSDPLRPINPGDPLIGRLRDSRMFNTLMQVAKDKTEKTGAAGAPGVKPIIPYIEAYILPVSSVLPGYVVTPTAIPHTFPDQAITAQRQPIFTVNAPSSADDLVMIVTRPAPGSTDQLGRAVVQGLAVINVEVTDADHEYAVPVASDMTKMVSAETGPVRIIQPRTTGTANRMCLVGSKPAAGGSGTVTISHGQAEIPTLYNLTTDDTWTATGLTLSLPSAGTYFLFGRLRVSAQVSSISGNPFIYTRLFDTTSTVAVDDSSHIALMLTDPDMAVQTANGSVCTVYTPASAPATIEVQIRRNSGSTWVASVMNGATGSGLDEGSHVGYLKISS